MVEPVAITLFRLVRNSEVEPVLCELLEYYEKDEARHIALGVQYLPTLIQNMSYPELFFLFIWQLKVMITEVDGLKELEKDFEVLGFEPDEVFKMAEKKQLEAMEMLGEELGVSPAIWQPMRRIISAKKDMSFGNESIVKIAYDISMEIFNKAKGLLVSTPSLED